MTDQNQVTKKGAENNAVLWIRAMVRLLLVGFFIGIPLFWGAGTLDWSRGWIFFALLGVSFAINLTVMLIKTPTLLRERWKQRKDTKRFDKVFGAVYLLSTLVMLSLAGVDSVRFEWTTMPWELLYLGVALHVLGSIPMLWSMLSNPHLETTVRIQTDRGHKVISGGPYRFVRHPMYVGIILMFLGWPLVLGSWAAFGVALFIVFLFFIRTSLEDKTLRNELSGYAEFCKRTRYRLVPGLW